LDGNERAAVKNKGDRIHLFREAIARYTKMDDGRNKDIKVRREIIDFSTEFRAIKEKDYKFGK
jgi:hypothetical protein